VSCSGGKRISIRDLFIAMIGSRTRWAWSTFQKKRADYEARMTQPEYVHLRFHRLKTRGAMRAFIEASARRGKGGEAHG
jgi:hypothetical protein